MMKIKFMILDLLASFFQWLEGAAQTGYNYTNVCHSCGKPKYFSQPCVKVSE